MTYIDMVSLLYNVVVIVIIKNVVNMGLKTNID